MIVGTAMTTDDFFRLATGLRAAIIDFDYAKTRKLLDPTWDGYDIPKGHDFVADDVDLIDANLLTSQHRDIGHLHRVVLDLDYGARVASSSVGHHLWLNMFCPNGTVVAGNLADALNDCGIPTGEPKVRWNQDKGWLEFHTRHDLALTQSSTPGHHHLILDANLPWSNYIMLLKTLAGAGVIEKGFAGASIKKGFSSIRPPWVKK
jgi:hypothetical protein